MKQIAKFAGAQVALDYTDGVRIVLTWRLREADLTTIRGLGQALGGFARFEDDGIGGRAEIRYTDTLDQRIVELIDLLIDIRMSHPTMVQLPLALDEAEARALEQALNG